MKPRSEYTVSYTPDESGMWVAEVVQLPGCLTQGRTIDQARTRIREAIQVYLDLPRPYAGELGMQLNIQTRAKRIVEKAVDAREVAAKAAEKASELGSHALLELTRAGIKPTDAGELLGVSRQRVHQLLAKTPLTRRNPIVHQQATPRRTARKRSPADLTN